MTLESSGYQTEAFLSAAKGELCGFLSAAKGEPLKALEIGWQPHRAVLSGAVWEQQEVGPYAGKLEGPTSGTLTCNSTIAGPHSPGHGSMAGPFFFFFSIF